MLKSVEPENYSPGLICSRITSPFYVTDCRTVGDASLIFSRNKVLNAFGVVNENGKPEGVIIKNELLSLIGQKFGRELYINKNIMEIAGNADRIYYKRNTFSVIDEISDDLNSAENRYYILIDSENNYKGLVSSFDLVLFLSDMMTRELRAARRIHSVIVKDEVGICRDRVAVSGSTRMAGETGGDFQYIRAIGEGRLFVSLCDVSGKGLNAGLISVAVTSMYAAYDFNKGIPGLIKKINSYIYGMFSGEIFLTGVFIELDTSSGRGVVYDMGHSMVYILRGRSVISPHDEGRNYPMGVQNEITPVMSEINLESGDLLISYSDGFPEQININNEDFGEQRCLGLAVKYRKSELSQIREILYEELKKWRFGQAQGDDMSLMLIRYK